MATAAAVGGPGMMEAAAAELTVAVAAQRLLGLLALSVSVFSPGGALFLLCNS
jgi:hypothetical protein